MSEAGDLGARAISALGFVVMIGIAWLSSGLALPENTITFSLARRSSTTVFTLRSSIFLMAGAPG